MALLTTPLPEDAPISTICDYLKIPKEFRYGIGDEEAETIATLEEWRSKAYVVLSDFKARLWDKQAFTWEEQGDIVSAVAPFDGDGPWVVDSSRETAQGTSTPPVSHV